MRVGVLELFVLGYSSASWAIELDVELLVDGLDWLLDQPSMAVGVARGIN
jgi:hypothetical protein